MSKVIITLLSKKVIQPLQLVSKKVDENIDIIYDYDEQCQYELGTKVFTFWFSRPLSNQEAEIFLTGQRLYIQHKIHKDIITESGYKLNGTKLIYAWNSYKR